MTVGDKGLDMTTKPKKHQIEDEARVNARRSVAQYSDSAIVTPHYHPSALKQTGEALAHGAGKVYVRAFADEFTKCWLARYTTLTTPVAKSFKKLGA